MKSRMDKYYKEEELMQRTSKNDFLYDELYKEKQIPSNNVTVLDNVNEIDITKIKAMVDKRENYSKIRDYNSVINNVDDYKNDEVQYNYEEIDESNYDINEIIKKKKNTAENSDKVRRISNKDYEMLSSLEMDDEDKEFDSINLSGHEKQLKDLYDTITNIGENTDLFANLKDDVEEEDKESKEEENESSFFTSTSKINVDDFGEDEEKNNSVLYIVIAIVTLLIAAALIIYFKFLK